MKKQVKKKIKCIGQGVSENTYHCFILEFKNGNFNVYETFDYNTPEKSLKSSINHAKWDLIKDYITIRINQFSTENNYKKNKFNKDINLLNTLLGKEISLLFWGIEATDDIKDVEKAIKNWQGLSPEERWYLYTMCNANLSTDCNKGWRGAVKKILIEN